MKFRLTMPEPAEHELAEQVARGLAALVLPPAMWTCFPAGNIPLPPQAAAKLYRLGLQRGWPDYLVLHHSLFGIELKRWGGRLSKSYMARTAKGGLVLREGQLDVFPRLERAGMTIAVCRSWEEVLTALQDWQIPLRATS